MSSKILIYFYYFYYFLINSFPMFFYESFRYAQKWNYSFCDKGCFISAGMLVFIFTIMAVFTDW